MAQHFPNDGTARPMSIVPAGSTSPAPELSSTYAGTAYQLVGDGDDDHRYMNQHLPSGGAATMSVTSSSPPPSTQPGYHPVPVTNRLYVSLPIPRLSHRTSLIYDNRIPKTQVPSHPLQLPEHGRTTILPLLLINNL